MALHETPLEIKVIFELGDATHAEVVLDESDARDLLAFLQRDGFVSNDSTVGQVANALKYVLEPEAPITPTRGYCECETPVMDVEHDAGCRRCGRPVDFSPRVSS